MKASTVVWGFGMKKSITIMKVGVFLALLAETYLNAALPALMGHFAVSAERVQWLTSLYILTMGLSVPISAFLIRRTTTKGLFISTMVLFCCGSLTASLAPSFVILLFARVIQAMGAAMTLPLMIHVIMATYEEGTRGKAMGAAMLVVLFAPAFGPTYGALVMQVLSWRWIFISNLVVAALVILWALASMERGSEGEKGSIDLLSILLSITGFGLFVYGMQQLLALRLGFGLSISLVATAVVAIALFALRQHTLSSPMLNLSVLGERTFCLGVALIVLIHLTVFGSFILLPMYLVEVLGLSAFGAGLAMLPGGLVGAIAPALAGRIYDRRGPRAVVVSGFGLLVVSTALLAAVGLHRTTVTVSLLYTLLMGGFGIALTPLQTHSLAQLERSELSSGTAIVNTLMLVASSMGGSLAVALMTAKARDAGFIDGFAYAYQVTALAAVVGFLLSLLFGSRDKRI